MGRFLCEPCSTLGEVCGFLDLLLLLFFFFLNSGFTHEYHGTEVFVLKVWMSQVLLSWQSGPSNAYILFHYIYIFFTFFQKINIYIYNIYIYVPESSKTVNFVTLHHQKQTNKGLKVDTLRGSRHIYKHVYVNEHLYIYIH